MAAGAVLLPIASQKTCITTAFPAVCVCAAGVLPAAPGHGWPGSTPADFTLDGISFLFAVPAVMGTAFFYAFFWMFIKMQLALPFAGWAGGARSLDRPLRQHGPGMFRYWIKYGEFPRNIRRNLRK